MSTDTAAGTALRCSAEVRRGTFELQIALEVGPGEIVGLIGANGSGKSTLLGSIAGTLPIHAGEIALGERTLSRRGPGAREVLLPRAARRVGLLDQRARLFPHLDAIANIAFGPLAQGAAHGEAAATARGWLERVGLAGREKAREAELSGGQQQRVAIARTLAARPEALLLDEPFAALDVTSGQELRTILAEQIRRLRVPTLLVTHDPIDLIALADRVIVLDAGRVVQHGTISEILTAPASDFAAEFSGRTLIRGVASARGTLEVPGAPVAEIAGANRLPEPGVPAVASFEPSAVRVRGASTGGGAPADPDSLHWVGTVSAIASSCNGVRIECREWPGFFAEVPVSRAAEPELQPGARVSVELAVDAITLATA